jgi:type VI secretion system protein ImpJ
MAHYHRMVWNEGLFLTPHHFQQWDLFQESQAAERLAVTSPVAWGIRSMEIDAENLARGAFRLLSFRGILPGGTLVRLPEIDPAPPSVPFQDAFDLRADRLDVFLGVPLRRSGWPNCLLPGQASEGTGESRYSARPVTVEDDNTGRNERAVQRAEMNLRILLGQEPRDDFESIPLARIRRTSAGLFQMEETFVPPLLALGASPYLERLARSLLERLAARSSELGARFTEGGADARDITPANLRAFLHFAVVNGAVPLLAHYRNLPGLHPEGFYRVLAALIGQLSTFNAARLHPRDVPPYDHENLGAVFTTCERLVVDLLELRVSQGYIVIPLVPAGEGRSSAVIEKESLLTPSSALFLAVSSEGLNERDILSGAPRIIVASPDRIQQRISLNLPGLPLQFTAVPPPAIPRRRGTYYFQLDSRGPEWEAIRAARSLVLDLPPDLRSAQIELLGLEGER